VPVDRHGKGCSITSPTVDPSIGLERECQRPNLRSADNQITAPCARFPAMAENKLDNLVLEVGVERRAPTEKTEVSDSNESKKR
jgi:hypothetical protein